VNEATTLQKQEREVFNRKEEIIGFIVEGKQPKPSIKTNSAIHSAQSILYDIC
jgi:hypothetical protein